MSEESSYTLPPKRRAVNLRSLFLGLLGVIFVCGLTAYNDYAMANTALIGTYVPIGLLLFMLILIILVNAPLSRWMPRWALSYGEMAVIMGMTLVSCGLPSSGLMTYLPNSIVSMHYDAANSKEYRQLLEKANLPDWILPRFETDKPGDRGTEEVIVNFYTRTPREQEGWRARLMAVPWKLWQTPAIGWGLLLIPMFGSYLCMSVIVRRQWAENERLPFPIAMVYLRLIEPPAPRKAFNSLFSTRAFWIAVVGVMAIHSLNALNQYFPRHVPAFPISFSLNTLLNEGPLRYTHWTFRVPTKISFSIVAVTFFLQSKIAFSLWAFYIIWQIVCVFYGSYLSGFPEGSRFDQMFGSMIVFALLVIWIGRHHWVMVLRHMFGLRRRHDPQDPYLPYALAGWGFALCIVGMIAWLTAVGTTLMGAIVLVAVLMTVMVTISRVVAETGLVYSQVHTPFNKPWIYLSDLAGMRTTPQNYFYSTWFYQMFGHDTRESLPVYSTHALRVADSAAYDPAQGKPRAWPFLIALVLAIIVGYFVSGASMLLVQYNYAEPMSINAQPPVNPWGLRDSTRTVALDPAAQYVVREIVPKDVYSRVSHSVFAMAFTGFLAFMRIYFTWWPFHPVGYLLAYSDPIARCWVSIFLGWLAKVLIVRFGGSSLFRSAQPFFIGLLVGEAGASALWLVISIILNSMGLPYYPMRFTTA